MTHNVILDHGGNGIRGLERSTFRPLAILLLDLVAKSTGYIVVKFGDDLSSSKCAGGLNVQSDLDPVQVKVMGQSLKSSFPISAMYL